MCLQCEMEATICDWISDCRACGLDIDPMRIITPLSKILVNAFLDIPDAHRMAVWDGISRAMGNTLDRQTFEKANHPTHARTQ